MLTRRRRRDDEHGQIIVVFALVLVVILAFAAIVVDLGVLRNDRQTLANALDAGALSGATLLPVDGTQSGATTAINARINREIQATMPGLQSGVDYQVEYRCLIGAVNGQPAIQRDIPAVCNPRNALGHTPVATDFIGAGRTRSSICDPTRGDRCNAVVLTGDITRAFTFGRAVNVNEGSTGVIVSAACNGPCGEPPFAPLDVVLIIDRTGSMAGDEQNLQDAANTVLGVYDPNVQHIGLGVLGPATLGTDCPNSPSGRKGIPLDVGNNDIQREGDETDETNGAENTITIDRPNNTSSGDFMLAQILYDDANAGVNIAAPSGWNLVRRTSNGTTMGQAIYYKVATGSESNTYTWRFRNAGGTNITTEAAGGIITYENVDTTNPFTPSGGSGSIGTGNTGTSTTLAATGVNTSAGDKVVVAFYGVENDTGISTPSSMTEQYENQVNNTASGTVDLTVSLDDDPMTGSGATGNKVASIGSSTAWIANLVVLRGVPSEYGTDVNTDIDKWIVAGLTGTGGGEDVTEAYSVAGVPRTTSGLYRTIDCVTDDDNLSSTGTNLATPMRMATEWLREHGRGGDVKQGIIFESDGTPNYNGQSGDAQNYRCDEAIEAAGEAKALGIEIFTIAFDIVGERCPDSSKLATTAMAEMSSSILSGTSCNAAENQDGDHFFCEPGGSDLSNVFQAAAVQLAGIRAHLVQIYPAPYVTSVAPAGGPAGGGGNVTISGSGFTGATSVSFGGTASPQITVNSDSSMTARIPAGSAGQTVHIRVTSPGGTSPAVNGDRYTYN